MSNISLLVLFSFFFFIFYLKWWMSANHFLFVTSFLSAPKTEMMSFNALMSKINKWKKCSERKKNELMNAMREMKNTLNGAIDFCCCYCCWLYPLALSLYVIHFHWYNQLRHLTNEIRICKHFIFGFSHVSYLAYKAKPDSPIILNIVFHFRFN